MKIINTYKLYNDDKTEVIFSSFLYDFEYDDMIDYILDTFDGNSVFYIFNCDQILLPYLDDIDFKKTEKIKVNYELMKLLR